MVLEKNGLKMEARNANQASAFLKNGWTELTDSVPEGALDDNPDGSVNVYDEDGNQIGTIDAETALEAQKEAGTEWTKTEINRMPVDELRKLAAENDIEDADKINGADLKKALIEKLGM